MEGLEAVMFNFIEQPQHHDNHDDNDNDDDNNSNRIDNLDDNVLLDILERIPWIWAVQCKSVCKKWYNLISNPCYRICSTFTFIFEIDFYDLYRSSRDGLVINAFTESPRFKTLGLSLSFLPCYDHTNPFRPIHIVTSHKNLLVCSGPPRSDETSYYIADPLMRRYLKIPPMNALQKVITYGLYAVRPNRYKFVRMSSFLDRENRLFCIDVFSSEIGVWKRNWFLYGKDMVFDYYQVCDSSNAVNLNHKLHWVFGNFVLVYDLCSETCTFLNVPLITPQRRRIGKVSYCLGEYEGQILLSELEDFAPCYLTIKMWELQDYNYGGFWRLVHHRTWWGCSNVNIYENKVLGFHPFDPTTLLMKYGDGLVRCNLRRGTLKEVMSWPGCEDSYMWKKMKVFPIVHSFDSDISLPFGL